jgi:hypothetical protein
VSNCIGWVAGAEAGAEVAGTEIAGACAHMHPLNVNISTLAVNGFNRIVHSFRL